MTDTPAAEPLDVVAGKIKQHAAKADEHVIAAALLMRGLRDRIEAGEAGDVTWAAWARRNIGLSDTRLRELHRIAEAEDPAKELRRLREQTQKRVAACRERKAAAGWRQDPERVELIEWVKTLPIEMVRRMHREATCLRDRQGSTAESGAAMLVDRQRAA